MRDFSVDVRHRRARVNGDASKPVYWREGAAQDPRRLSGQNGVQEPPFQRGTLLYAAPGVALSASGKV